jgi:hypothetical protein
MIPANSLSCSSSRNIKEFQRDLRLSHSQTVLFTIPPKSTLYFKEKNQVMTNQQTQLFSIDHKSPQCLKKRVISKTNILTSDFNRWTPPAQHAFCHQSTSLSRSLGHAFADNNPSMPNMSSEAFYPLQCCHSSSCCFCSCCYLQAPAKIAARWR